MNYNKIAQYVFLALGLSSLGLYIPSFFMDPENLATPLLQIFLYSWGPAAAAWIVQKKIYKESLARYGWNRKRFSFNWIGKSILAPVGVALGTLVLVFVMGNMLGMPDFGQVVLGQSASATFLWPGSGESVIFHGGNEDSMIFFGMMQGFPELLNRIMLPPELWTLFTLIAVIGIISGASINLVFNVGEEMGWRGFMIAETKSMGYLGSTFVTGALYGLWQLPLFLYALPELDGDVFWMAWAHIGFALAISFPLAYFSMKTRSVYAPATFVGVLNNISILPMFFIIGGSTYLSGVKGLAGMLILMIFTYGIIRYDKKFVDGFSKFEF